jgi:hypothetical protein
VLSAEGVGRRILVLQKGQTVEGRKAYRIFVWEVNTMTLTYEILVHRRWEVNTFSSVDLGCRPI